MAILNWIIFIAIFGVGLLCLFKNREWALPLHQYYIRESKKHWYGKFFPWEKSWAIVIFRAMIIGLGIILTISAYPLVFGPIYL